MSEEWDRDNEDFLTPEEEEETDKSFEITNLIDCAEYHLEKAMEYYDDAVSLKPNDLSIIEKYKKIEIFHDDFDINYINISLYNRLGQISLDEEKFEDAYQFFKKTLELDANSEEANFGLGIVYENYGNYDKAISLFEKVLEISPNHDQSKLKIKSLKNRTKIDLTLNKNMIKKWLLAKNELKLAKDHELELRKAICSEIFKDQVIGTKRLQIDDLQIYAYIGTNYKIDNYDLDKIKESLSETEKQCIKYKPTIMKTKYDALDDKSILKQIIKITIKSPRLEVK